MDPSADHWSKALTTNLSKSSAPSQDVLPSPVRLVHLANTPCHIWTTTVAAQDVPGLSHQSHCLTRETTGRHTRQDQKSQIQAPQKPLLPRPHCLTISESTNQPVSLLVPFPCPLRLSACSHNYLDTNILDLRSRTKKFTETCVPPEVTIPQIVRYTPMDFSTDPPVMRSAYQTIIPLDYPPETSLFLEFD